MSFKFKPTIIFVIIFFSSIYSPSQTSWSSPEWSYNKAIYEVNIRQYSKAGDFKGFEKAGYRTIGIGGVGWFDTTIETSKFWATDYFQEFYWNHSFSALLDI